MGELPICCKSENFDINEDKIVVKNRNGNKTNFTCFDIKNHNEDYIKIGFCAGMSIINKDEENYIRLKFPKKEKELKDFFNYTGTKVSYDINVKDCNQKFLYYEKLLDMTEEEVNAYLCGLISANCSVNKSKDYRRECVRFRLPEKREMEGSKGEKWFKFYEKISKCLTYSSGKGLGVMCSIPDLEYFIKKIGIIQKDKMNEIVKLYFSKVNKAKEYNIEIIKK